MTIALWLAVGSIPGALGGVQALHALERALGGASFETVILGLVAGALFVTGIAVLARALFMRSDRERESVLVFDVRHKVAAVGVGVGVGFVLGLTSAGSGALIAVALIMLFRLTPIRVVGTDVFHAAILLWVAAAAHFLSGNVDLGLAATILIGSIPGVWIGSNLAFKMPADALRPMLGIVLLAASLALTKKAGADIPIYVIFLVPAAVAVAAWALHRNRQRKHNAAAPSPSPSLATDHTVTEHP
jgi:uncharacterized membrane protein YfcA